MGEEAEEGRFVMRATYSVHEVTLTGVGPFNGSHSGHVAQYRTVIGAFLVGSKGCDASALSESVLEIAVDGEEVAHKRIPEKAARLSDPMERLTAMDLRVDLKPGQTLQLRLIPRAPVDCRVDGAEIHMQIVETP